MASRKRKGKFESDSDASDDEETDIDMAKDAEGNDGSDSEFVVEDEQVEENSDDEYDPDQDASDPSTSATRSARSTRAKTSSYRTRSTTETERQRVRRSNRLKQISTSPKASSDDEEEFVPTPKTRKKRGKRVTTKTKTKTKTTTTTTTKHAIGSKSAKTKKSTKNAKKSTNASKASKSSKTFKTSNSEANDAKECKSTSKPMKKGKSANESDCSDTNTRSIKKLRSSPEAPGAASGDSSDASVSMKFSESDSDIGKLGDDDLLDALSDGNSGSKTKKRVLTKISPSKANQGHVIQTRARTGVMTKKAERMSLLAKLKATTMKKEAKRAKRKRNEKKAIYDENTSSSGDDAQQLDDMDEMNDTNENSEKCKKSKKHCNFIDSDDDDSSDDNRVKVDFHDKPGLKKAVSYRTKRAPRFMDVLALLPTYDEKDETDSSDMDLVDDEYLSYAHQHDMRRHQQLRESALGKRKRSHRDRAQLRSNLARAAKRRKLNNLQSLDSNANGSNNNSDSSDSSQNDFNNNDNNNFPSYPSYSSSSRSSRSSRYEKEVSLASSETYMEPMMDGCGDFKVSQTVLIEVCLMLSWNDVCALARCNQSLCSVCNTDLYWGVLRNRQMKWTLQALVDKQKCQQLGLARTDTQNVNTNNNNNNNISDAVGLEGEQNEQTKSPKSPDMTDFEDMKRMEAMQAKAQEMFGLIPAIRPIAWDREGVDGVGAKDAKDVKDANKEVSNANANASASSSDWKEVQKQSNQAKKGKKRSKDSKKWKRGVLFYVQKYCMSSRRVDRNDTRYFGLFKYMPADLEQPAQFFAHRRQHHGAQVPRTSFLLSRRFLIRLNFVRELANIRHKLRLAQSKGDGGDAGDAGHEAQAATVSKSSEPKVEREDSTSPKEDHDGSTGAILAGLANCELKIYVPQVVDSRQRHLQNRVEIDIDSCRRHGIKSGLLELFFKHFDKVWNEPKDLFHGLRVVNQLYVEHKIHKIMSDNVKKLKLVSETIRVYSEYMRGDSSVGTGDVHVKPSNIFEKVIGSMKDDGRSRNNSGDWYDPWLDNQVNEIEFTLQSPNVMLILQITEIMRFLAKKVGYENECYLDDLEVELEQRAVVKKRELFAEDSVFSNDFEALMEVLRQRADFKFDESGERAKIFYQPQQFDEENDYYDI